VSRSLLAFAGGSAGTSSTTSSSSSSSSKGARSSGRLGGPVHCGVAADQPARPAVNRQTATTASLGLARSQAQQGQPRPLVVFDIDETLLSNMPQILDPEAWPWEDWVAAARAEPLQPMAAFYAALCR
jgi:predicted secreted acid phosphatase